jgi:(2R)-sulfolactate sulfo-lyase subunit alpha
MATDIIIHDKKDNVGVVVIEKITPQARLCMLDNGR